MLTGNDNLSLTALKESEVPETKQSVQAHPSKRPDLASYRHLALQLHYDLDKPGSRSALLVSPDDATHCSRSVAALAEALAAELSRPILLVDSAIRSEGVGRLLDCAADEGFADLLNGSDRTLESLVLETSAENVYFLPSGAQSRSSQPPSDRVPALLLAAEQRFDFVLFAGGALKDDSTALALAPFVGCVLVVAAENQTAVQEIEAAQQSLAYSKPRKLGLVLTT